MCVVKLPRLPLSLKGFSLIEAAIVLGIVGLVIGGIWIAAANINERIRWQQTEEGWLYYMDLIMKNFNQKNVANFAPDYQDIDRQFLMMFPLPAGWSTKDTGGSGVHLYDPMGNFFFAQVQWRSQVMVGPYTSPDNMNECIKYGLLIATRIDRLYTRTAGGPAPGCSAGDLAACCSGLSIDNNHSARVRYALPPN